MSKYIGASAVNLSTTSADVTGNADIDGNLTVGGNLTVSGTTITVDHATAQTVDLGDDDKIRLGADYELQLWSDGTTGQISGDINHTGSITTDGLTVDGAATVTGTSTLASGTNGEMQLGLGTALVTGAGTYDSAVRANGGGSLLLSTGATKRFQINTIGDISFYDTNGNNSLNWDASEKRLGIGMQAPTVPLHIMSGSNNSTVARFTGGQINNGLTISTYSSGGLNDGGATLEVPKSMQIRADGDDIAFVSGEDFGVNNGKQFYNFSKRGPNQNGGGSNHSVRLGRLAGTGTRARIELTGSIGYGSPLFGKLVIEVAQGNVNDTFGVNCYYEGGTTQTFKDGGASNINVYTDRIDAATFDVWVRYGSFSRMTAHVIEQSGWTPYYDNVSSSGTSIPATAVQSNHRSQKFMHQEFLYIRDDQNTPIASFDTDGLKFGSDTAAANALNDYETGSWQPQIYYQNTSDQAAATNTVQSGRYTKIGNLVHCQFRLDWNPPSSPANDNIGVKNFPFPGADNHYNAQGVLIGTCNVASIQLAHLSAGGTRALVLTASGGGNLGDDFGNASGRYIRGSITYHTSA